MTWFVNHRAALAVTLLVAMHAASAASPQAAPVAYPPARSVPGLPASNAPAAPPAASPVAPATAGDSNDSRIRIQLVSRDQVDVSSEVAAKIASLPFRDGDAFRAGQTLVTLDCSLFSAQLRKAQADADGARDLLETNRKLQALRSIGDLEVQQAQAKQKSTAADVAYMQATVRKCSIAAPFDGRVSKRSAAPQQFAEPGKPLLTIVDTSHLELKMIVPSKWLGWLRTGHALSVQVDEVGKTYPAKVVRIGARVDPVTQTVDVTAALNGSAPELLPGMSGWATFAR
ncbi:efflux transporter periplasmic adaptor subunit [Pandoraea capi]|uniref:Efflux transporter periplasmic adaptor subunit n=1 Tax=Pandoraea capi TaxID=2508286 RepID=A0ABY6WCG9_9BURK|nr:efflux RND transporter periplasmic adaptor subunit [Pandoraea capi]VVE49734.1 efflux transporter periplasmic adaptor subunit [Pandoraea capi]